MEEFKNPRENSYGNLGEAISVVEEQSEKGAKREYETLRVNLMTVDRSATLRKLLEQEFNLLNISWMYFANIEDIEKVKEINVLLTKLLKEVHEHSATQANKTAKEIALLLNQS